MPPDIATARASFYRRKKVIPLKQMSARRTNKLDVQALRHLAVRLLVPGPKHD
jgi:hypothetical protein